MSFNQIILGCYALTCKTTFRISLLFISCHITSTPTSSVSLTLAHYLWSHLRSALPFVNMTPWPASDKDDQLTRSALCFRLSTALFNQPLFPFLFSQCLCFIGDWFKSCSMTDLMLSWVSKWGEMGSEKVWGWKRKVDYPCLYSSTFYYIWVKWPAEWKNMT